MNFPTRNMSSPIMKSLDPRETLSDTRLESLSLTCHPYGESVHLLDDQENLLIKGEKEFLKYLQIDPSHKVKVVAIFGNTGEGKSHTMNHTFFNGNQIFRTSNLQNSCTIGVWARYDPKLRVICLDTEGLLGLSKKENQRTRLLLKVLAVSDVIIYRTKAERLQRDMYTFLGGASRAYREHFSTALMAVLQKCGVENPSASLGPAVVIFHQTTYTDTLHQNASVKESPEDLIRENFAKLEQNCDGFSSLKYIGFKGTRNEGMFKELRVAVEKELESTNVRSPRDPKYIFFTLKGLNEKFQSSITEPSPQLYLSAFFTCRDQCLSCGAGCTLSMGHKDEGESHFNKTRCRLQHQFQNFVYLCRKCNLNGLRQVVQPCYQTKKDQFWSSIISVWSGYIIECPVCGVIYQSREYWYGNKDPKDEAVIIDIVHVWPGDRSMFGSQNSAQKVLDGVTSLTNAVASVGSQPTKMISDWVTDQIAPSYWTPNHKILKCHKCMNEFTSNASKHHCRACGEGFCERCSSKTKPVPWRGWHENVRVCDACFDDSEPKDDAIDNTEVRSRQIGETVINSISAVKSVLEIPKDVIKETARPSYWTPNNECIKCAVCDKPFGILLSLHHCRECGKGVCDDCSLARKPVPDRGWEYPTRVCDNCC